MATYVDRQVVLSGDSSYYRYEVYEQPRLIHWWAAAVLWAREVFTVEIAWLDRVVGERVHNIRCDDDCGRSFLDNGREELACTRFTWPVELDLYYEMLSQKRRTRLHTWTK